MTGVGASAGEEIGTEADGYSGGTSGWRMRGGGPGWDPMAGGKRAEDLDSCGDCHCPSAAQKTGAD